MTNRLPSIDTNADDLVDNDKVEGLKNFGVDDSFSGFPLTEQDLNIGIIDPLSATNPANASGTNALAVGSDVNAKDTGSIAIGTQVDAGDGNDNGEYAIAIGGENHGSGTSATGPSSTAIGADATVTDTGSVAIGDRAESSAGANVAIGQLSNAGGTQAISILGDAQASASIALGQNAVAEGFYSTAIGDAVESLENESVSIGRSATTGDGSGNGVRSIAIGAPNGDGGPSVTEDDSIAIGTDAFVDAWDSVAIGSSASASNSSHSTVIGSDGGSGPSAIDADVSLVLGRDATSTGPRAIAAGSDAYAKTRYSIAIGDSAVAGNTDGGSAWNAIAIGSIGTENGTEASGNSSIAIGEDAVASSDNAIALGKDTSVAVADVARIGTSQLVFGSQDTLTDSDLNNNEVALYRDGASDDIHARYQDGGGVNFDTKLSNPSAGDGLTESSNTFDIEPADFAGNALEDDGSDNLAVSTDGIQTDEIDLSISPVWTSDHEFSGGLTDGAGVTHTGELADASDLHAKYTDEEAQDAVGTILSADFTYDDAGNAINISPHVSTSDAHHSKTSSASELTDVSADSVSDAHHTKTVDTHLDVEDDGTSIVADASKIDFGGSHFDVTNPSGSEAAVSLTSDSIGTDEIDLSISPTWTDLHTFDGHISVGKTIKNANDNGALQLENTSKTILRADGQTGTQIEVSKDDKEIVFSVSETLGSSVAFFDQNESDRQVQYLPGGDDGLGNALPGTLELTNADLKIPEGQNIIDDNDDNRLRVGSSFTTLTSTASDAVVGVTDSHSFLRGSGTSQSQSIKFEDSQLNEIYKYDENLDEHHFQRHTRFKNGIEMETGTTIADESDTKRLDISSDSTKLYGPDGEMLITLNDDVGFHQHVINGTYNWRILDEQSSQTVASVGSVSSGENEFTFDNSEVALRSHSASNSGPSLRWYDNDGGNRVHFHVNSNGDFEFVPVNSSTSTQHWKAMVLSPDQPEPLFGNGIDLDNNLVNNKGGIWASTLGSVQNDAETGIYAEIWGNVDISDSTFTKNSDTELEINKSGIYKISCSLKIERNGSSGRNIMSMQLEKNGTKMGGRTEVYGYIRNDTGGDLVTLDFDRNLELNNGDTLKVYVQERNGGETGNDLIGGWADIEYIS